MKQISVLLSVLVVIVLCTAPASFARAISPVDGVEALRRTLGGTSDFTAEFTQEKRLSLMKRAMIMTGTLRFKKPDLFLMEINPPFSGRVLLKDTVIEQTTGRDGEKNRIVLPPEQGLNHWFSKLASPVKSLPEGLAVQADLTDAVYTLVFTPQGKGLLKDITISFQQDGTIRQLVIREQNGDRATMTLKKIKRNTGLSAKDFRLE